MFGLQPKFSAIRTEMVDIHRKLSPYITNPDEPPSMQVIVGEVCHLLRILIRIIDALP